MAARTEPGADAVVRGPIDRLTARIPPPWRTAVDWLLTIAIAVGAVLAIKQWVVNPYRIPSSSMEPTLHCAEPGDGCTSQFSDRVLANRFIYHLRDPERGDVIVFNTPARAEQECFGASGTFVKRLVGLPGETISGRQGRVFVDGEPLEEPYLESERRDDLSFGPRMIPEDHYFFMGDNRAQSCDSRRWGAVPRENLIGEVFAVYWPPQRIGFR
jgi:signal peptidase I